MVGLLHVNTKVLIRSQLGCVVKWLLGILKGTRFTLHGVFSAEEMFVAAFSEQEQRELAEKLTSLLSTYRHISDSYIIVMNQQLLLFQCLSIINTCFDVCQEFKRVTVNE